MMSSVMPSLKKVWSGELQRFSNGNTAINVRADAEDIDGAAIGVYLNARRERVWRYS